MFRSRALEATHGRGHGSNEPREGVTGGGVLSNVFQGGWSGRTESDLARSNRGSPSMLEQEGIRGVPFGPDKAADSGTKMVIIMRR